MKCMTRHRAVHISALRGLFPPQAEIIGDHGDELAVRRLALYVRHRVPEELLQGLDVAAVPCDLDGMAYGALDTGRGVVANFFATSG